MKPKIFFLKIILIWKNNSYYLKQFSLKIFQYIPISKIISQYFPETISIFYFRKNIFDSLKDAWKGCMKKVGI